MGFMPSRIWTQQPQQHIPAFGSDLMRGAYVWTPHNPTQLIGKRVLVASSETAYNSSPVGDKGIARKWNRTANAGLDFGINQIITQNSGVTVLVVAAPTSAATMKVPFSQRVGSGAFTQTDFVFNSVGLDSLGASAGTVVLTTYSGASGGVHASGQIDGKTHCWVAGNGPSNGFIYRDGVKQTLATSTRISTFTASTQKLTIGNIADEATTTYPCDDPVYLVVVWDRLLSEPEARSVSENPWQVFSPLRKNIFESVVTGGNTGLSVQKSTHAHISDHVSTSFSTLLPISDSTHGVTSDQLALALLSVLSIAESTHSHVADSISLAVSGIATISISDGQHAHIADGVVVSTNWLLAINDAIHGHLLDGIILDTSNASWLSIQEAAHGHACDSLSLSTQAWLSIVDAAHAHLADSPTIYSGQFALQVAEALHSVSSDAPYLSLPGGALVPNPRYIVKAIARQMMVKASSRNNTVKR